MKTLFQNGTIIDGTGGKPYIGDVLIEDDRILEVGGTISSEADKMVNLEGLQTGPSSSRALRPRLPATAAFLPSVWTRILRTRTRSAEASLKQ